MSNNNILLEKTYNFSIRIVKLYKYMVSNQKEYTLSKQILRSGTSIGANVEEAIGGISKKTSYQNSQFHTKKQERLTTGSDF